MMAPVPLHPCEAALAALPENVLVGVSGGVDSMALLHALAATGRRPIVLHFDHGWREESADDAAWVRDEARGLRLRFVTARVHALAKRHRESEARAARYAFFAKVAVKLKIPDIVQGHHADDQVETFLMQLLRGTGVDGRGMEAVSWRNGLIIHRPWLMLWKKEIRAYARLHKIAWREDASNADVRHRRNLVRHRLLPYLKKHWSPQVAENLLRAAEIARAEGEWLDALCEPLAAATELDVKALSSTSSAQQRRTILRWLRGHGVMDISFADVEAVRRLLAHRTPAKVNLSAGKFARRRAGVIFVE